MAHIGKASQSIMSKKCVRVFSALLIMLISSFSFATSASAEELDTIRIGFFRSEKYGYTTTDGDLRGYDIQLSKTIGMYGRFNAEMLGYDNVTEMEEALRTGEVDVLIDFLRNEKREKEFIFTANSILDEQVSVYTYNAPDAPSAGNVAEIGGLRIGYVTGSGFLDYFTDYCAESGISPQLVGFHDESAMHSAMDRGETDACMTGSAVPTGYRVLVSTPPISSYMMLRAKDVALCNRIDSAINQLKTDDQDYIPDLYNRYIASRNAEMSPLTTQEREYLAEHPDLSVAVARDAEPFVYEKNDGSLGGVVIDYYKALGGKLGITFRFVAFDSTQDAMDAVVGGSADILGHYYGDIIVAEKSGLYDTMEYGSTECARLTKSDFTGQVKTIAVTNRVAYLMAEQVESDIRLKTYPNVAACYEALTQGEVDAVIGSMAGISWLINQHTMRGLSLSILPNVTLGIRGAVAYGNSTLLFILNKAIAASASSMDEAILENAINGKTSLRTAIENLPLVFTVGVVFVLTTLVVFLIISLILLRRSSKERMSLLNREMNVDGLTGAGSRRYGTELLNRELTLYRRYGDGPLIVMFDVDHFKNKNDTFGHEYGDHVLKGVVDVLRDTLRKSDEIIRWGGDEFILICPRIRDDGANRILEKTIRAINSADFTVDGKGERITISAGASMFAPEDRDTASVLRRCDSALYRAKKTRNTYCIYSDGDESIDK